MENCTYNQQKITNHVFNFVYGCAMHDAILQRAFDAKEKKWVGEVESAKGRLREYVDKVLRNQFHSQDDHDGYFLQTANDICRDINAERPATVNIPFSFGNAQKLVNIAVKHVYSFCYYNPELRIGFRYCHCPVDWIMLTKVWDMYSAFVGKKKCTAELGTKSVFSKPWGSEGVKDGVQSALSSFPERYDRFQRTVKALIGEGDLYPVEFDYVYWK